MIRRKHKKARLLTMDELHARPCEVDGRPALLHRWIEEEDALLKMPRGMSEETYEDILQLYYDRKIILSACEVTTTRHTRALVEYRDGTIAKVDPERIRFVEEVGQA